MNDIKGQALSSASDDRIWTVDVHIYRLSFEVHDDAESFPIMLSVTYCFTRIIRSSFTYKCPIITSLMQHIESC